MRVDQKRENLSKIRRRASFVLFLWVFLARNAEWWASARLSYLCEVNTGSVQRLKLPYNSLLFFCFCCKHTAFDTHVRYSHYVAIFQTVVPSFLTNTPPPLSLYYSLPSSFGFCFFLPAVCSYLLLGLVDQWPSTHEPLDIWTWRDLSPLLPDHTHRWDLNFLKKKKKGEVALE